jgi:hypothetical protein
MKTRPPLDLLAAHKRGETLTREEFVALTDAMASTNRILCLAVKSLAPAAWPRVKRQVEDAMTGVVSAPPPPPPAIKQEDRTAVAQSLAARIRVVMPDLNLPDADKELKEIFQRAQAGDVDAQLLNKADAAIQRVTRTRREHGY